MDPSSPLRAATVQGDLEALLRSGLPLKADHRELVVHLSRPESRSESDAVAIAQHQLLRTINTLGRRASEARILFGFDELSSGMRLTARRQLAASVAGYEVHHFRKRIEPRIVEELAALILTLYENIRRREMAPPPFLRTSAAYHVPDDPLEILAISRERHISRMWSIAYETHATILDFSLAEESSERCAIIDNLAQKFVAWCVLSALHQADLGELPDSSMLEELADHHREIYLEIVELVRRGDITNDVISRPELIRRSADAWSKILPTKEES